MENVLVIGRMNMMTQRLHGCLCRDYLVKLATDNSMVIAGMLDKERFDVIILNLNGLDKSKRVILTDINNNHPEIPVICVGDEKDKETFENFWGIPQFVMFSLPFEDSDLYAEIAAAVDGGIQDLDKGQRGQDAKHLLLVDDNAVELRALRELLKSEYSVAVAVSCSEALVSLEKKRPDLIILDYEMPVCDGRETLSIIRDNPKWKNIPVIFLTGVRDRAHIQAVLSLHPKDYLLKPVDADRLKETIERIIKEEA